MATKTLKKRTKAQIKLDNAKFNRLTPMKKRVAVAKDVISQLNSGTFIAGWGYGSIIEAPCMIPFGGDLQNLILKKGVVCEGCAKGACIASRARLGDNVNMDYDSWSEQQAHDVTNEIFGKECADLVEGLYEEWDMDDTYDGEKASRLTKYSESLPSRAMAPKARMQAIYQNIIDNCGYLKVGRYKF